MEARPQRQHTTRIGTAHAIAGRAAHRCLSRRIPSSSLPAILISLPLLVACSGGASTPTLAAVPTITPVSAITTTAVRSSTSTMPITPSVTPTRTATATTVAATNTPLVVPQQPSPSPAPTVERSVSPTASVLYAAVFSTWFTGAETAPFPFRAAFDPASKEYHLALTDPTRVYGYIRYAPEQREFGDFQLDVDVRRVAGNDNGGSYGVVFRAQSQGAGDTTAARYLFLVQPTDGTFVLNLVNADGRAASVAPRTSSAAIQGDSGTNHLTIICRSEQITLAINGQTVGTYPAAITGAGAIGVTVANPTTPSGNTGMEAAFKNLRITALSDGR